MGIDRTYYATIPPSAFAAYAAAVPDDFRFLVKAPERVTAPRIRDADGVLAANPTWLDAAWTADQVVAPLVEGLGAKAGPLVFQFPPQGASVVKHPGRFADRIGSFLAALQGGTPTAVELRDRSC